MKRKHVYYKGSVQGVGFRYTTQRSAANFKVKGYVRNMADGRVEVVVEGQEGEIELFLEHLAESMSGYIRDTQVVDEPYTGEFSRFQIRF